MVRNGSQTNNQVSTESAVLKNLAQSIQLNSEEETFFLSLLQEKTYPKKHHVLEIGGLSTEQNFVVKGCLKVYYLDEQGNEHIVKFALENWWAYDIESFYHSSPAFYGITCLEETTVLQLSKDAYETLVCKIPLFEKFYRIQLQNSFIALQHRMTQSLALTAQVRYERFQQKYPGLEKRISQKNIASYLGITPVFLSMIRKEYLTKQ